MADISLQRKHKLGLKKAKEAAQKVADDLAETFDMESEWDGNTLNFERSGVNGQLVVTKELVVMDAKLGFLLSVFKIKIEEQINENFDKYFA
jgi:putative polyhydroxyalkanoate system protein